MVSKTTAIYIRDTEATGSEDRQLETALDYATTVLDLDPAEILVLSDTALRARNTSSSGDQKLFDLAAEGAIGRVIVRDASRIAMNMRDLYDRVTQLVECGVAVHIVESGLRINDPESESDGGEKGHTMLRALGVAAELETAMNSRRTKEGIAAARAEGKHVGRPPFGFDSDGNGNLVPNEDYETALAVITEIETGESKRAVAHRADITRATVRNIVDRKEIYRSD
ncbi:recombinase family protein [Halalkalicoccus subterraneus]|uniref:recombinase family protein n=1 Tax=Halalkalicoccus subterraneus TaxID=2675002 RepID=UPI000EFCB123|nr:recombinase family protein [Halalkalicoccus subterraneus]